MNVLRFGDFINEALGVPENIIPLAKTLFNFIINSIDPDAPLKDLVHPIIINGNFNISDMKIKEIIFLLEFECHNNPYSGTELIGMGSVFDRKVGVIKKYKSPKVRTLNKEDVLIRITLYTSTTSVGDDIIEYFNEEKNDIIPILAHELKHFYDKYKKPNYDVSVWSKYGAITSNKFGDIDPLNDFLFISYYIHEFENLVIPTELAARIDVKGIKPDEFLDFFKDSDAYKNLKNAENFSLEELKIELGRYIHQINFVLMQIGYNPFKLLSMTDDETIDLALSEFYKHLIIWSGRIMMSALFPTGRHPFRLAGKKEEYFNDYLKKISRFKSYEEFFEYEERFFKSESKRMIKKLSKLYELTYKNK